MQTPSPENLRNIAIIAHVDHGKTTLVDHLLRQAGTFRDNEHVVDRVMDSMDLERERGITILAKNTAVWYGDTKINIVDTPGHADFGGEVERVLKMVDGAMLLVDASEGPLPQTRFVLGKALAAGLEVMLCINKIDRPDARPAEVLNEVYDLFIDLDATEEQLEFPVLYACAREGWCHTEMKLEPGDLKPMFEAIISHIPAPKGKVDAPVQMLVTQLDHDPYVGRLAIGRVVNGSVERNKDHTLIGEDGLPRRVRVQQLYTYQGLKRVEADRITAGEIGAIAGIEDLNIGDTLADVERPKALPRVKVEEPTIGVTFLANTSPLAGKDGRYMTARQIRERLEKECLTNVAVRIDPEGAAEGVRLFGRGELQIGILIEQLRREGWELCVSKPEVALKEEDGRTLEPFETALLDFPEEFMGVISEKMNLRKGRMQAMRASSGRVRVEYLIPSRGLIGFRGEYLNDTRGQGILNTLFYGWDEHQGYIALRKNGSLVADRKGPTTAYALFHLQPRGKLFVGPGVEVYEGMVVGENSRENDMNVNACRGKQLTNVRSAGADEKLILTPPMQLTLEKGMEFIAEDELMEVTPKNIRLRKKVLEGNLRSVVRGEKKDKK